jgi:hypothetical protein
MDITVILDAILKVAVQFATLAGVAAFVAMLINFMKVVKLVKDGDAGMWSGILNLAALIILIAVKIFKPDVDVLIIDKYAQVVTSIGLILLGYVLQIKTSSGVNNTLAKASIPILGKSYEMELQGK